jgi:exodeoxyribonuclease V beta subunit
VALHRYLQCRLPGYDYDLHFGGAFYIFLRGVEAANFGTTGIYADRPPKALIEAVTALLLDCEGANHAA